MAKSATVTVTKTATRRANTKTAKPSKSDKPKRAPTAYNLFVQAHMKPWLEANKDKTVKDAMVEIGALWRNAPENPNRGKEVIARKPKAAKDNAGKAKTIKPKAKSTTAKPADDEEGTSSEVDQVEDDE